MNVSIVIPAYNEEKGIAGTIDGVIEAIKPLRIEYELIVVNDGSTDNTAELVENKNIKIINHQENKGYGASIKAGIRNSQYEDILIIDADGSYPPEHIPDLLDSAIICDMVVGARVGSTVKIPLIRKPAKWFINKLANYLTGVNIPDLNSGLRVMKREVVEKYIRILPDGFSFTSTITLAMLTNGYSIEYVPIDYLKRDGKSKIRPMQDTLNFIQLIIRTILYFNPLRVFIPLSLFLVLLAFLVLLGSWVLTDKTMDVTFGVILMTAVMVMVIGMLADLIDKRVP